MLGDDKTGSVDTLQVLDLPANEIYQVLPGGAALDEELLEESIYEIRRTSALAGLARIVAIVERIIQLFALGNREHFRVAHERHVTWGALADHSEQIGIDFTTLTRYVGVYYQLEKFPKQINEALDPSAHMALLPLTDDTTRLAIASKAAQLGLGVREVRAEVAAVDPKKKSGRGRKASPAATKALRALSKAATALGEAVVDEVDPALSDDFVAEIDRLMQLLPRVRAELEALEPDDGA